MDNPIKPTLASDEVKKSLEGVAANLDKISKIIEEDMAIIMVPEKPKALSTSPVSSSPTFEYSPLMSELLASTSILNNHANKILGLLARVKL